MKRVFTLRGDLALALAGPVRPGAASSRYPTDGLQRGLLLVDGAAELSGEGVGFGVPVLKRGARAVFAGDAEVTWDPRTPGTITVTYVMDRAERLGGRGGASPLLVPLDLAREAFALLYRRAPALRRALMACSVGARRLLHVRTGFEPIPPVARIPVTYSLLDGAGGGDAGAGGVDAGPAEDAGALLVRVDLSGVAPEVTEVVVMNELGAACFDEYVEEGGRTEEGRHIGAWDPVRAASAVFRGGDEGVWFRLERAPDPDVPGARLYRGREVVRGRLSWAGFGYSLRPGPASFGYVVRIGRGSGGA